MKDLGLMPYFIALQVYQKVGNIFLSQGKFILKLLERCRMVESKFMSTPMQLNFQRLCGTVAGIKFTNPYAYRQLVGGLMFLVKSYPDICFTENSFQFMVEPHPIHWIAAKNLLR